MSTILSIQSHVAFGYVGNKAATFPLQLLGHEVVNINTVQFSNHTGYGKWQGQVFSAEHISDIIFGLEELGVLEKCNALLSGYLGDASIGSSILTAYRKIKALNPGVIYCLDPVMGDIGRGLYVRPGIFEFFKNEAFKFADIISPNQFEAEKLTDTTITNIQDAKNAAIMLHKMGPKLVLITSLTYTSSAPTHLDILIYDGDRFYSITTPWIKTQHISIAGSGDTTAALFLGHYLKNHDIKRSLELTVNSMYNLFVIMEASNLHELPLIAGQDAIKNPIIRFRVL
jgi:pyridoxine kinase